MNLLINGLGTLLLWIGGKVFGLMRVLLLGCPGILVIDFIPNGKFGIPMSLWSKRRTRLIIGYFAIGVEIGRSSIESSY